MSGIPRTGHTLWCQSGEVVPSLPWLACLHRSGQPWGSQAGKTAPPSSTVGLHRPGVSLRIQDGETVPHSSKAGLYRVILALGSQVGEAVSLSSTVDQCPIFNIWPPRDLPAGLLLYGLDSKGRTGARPRKLCTFFQGCSPHGCTDPIFHDWRPQNRTGPGVPGWGSCAPIFHNWPF